MYILNIETATKNCSVSLGKDGVCIAVKEFAEQGFSHAEKLHVFIEEILSEQSITFNDLNAVAVSKGPGSYTGLRIGVSAAKGLCYALNIPLISIDTLSLLAHKLTITQGIIIPMIDARRMEVYSAIYDSSYTIIRDVQAEIITSESFVDRTDLIHIVGDSSEKVKTVLNHEKFVFHDEIVFPSSREMVKLANDKFLKNDFEDVAYFEPFYLKDFILVK